MNKAWIILVCLLVLCGCASPNPTLPPTAAPSPLPAVTLTAQPAPTLTPSPAPSPTLTAAPKPTRPSQPSATPRPTPKPDASILFSVDISKEGKTLSSAILALDGKAFAVQTTDGQVEIWEVSSGASWMVALADNEATTVLGSNGAAYLLAAASLTNSEDIALWVITPGQEKPALITINPNAGFVTALAFSNNGKILAAGFSSGKINFYDSSSGELTLAIPEAHSDWVMLLAFSPDDRHLLTDSLSFDPRTLVFDVKSGKKVATLAEDSFDYMPGAFSPDGSLVAFFSIDGTAVFDTATWKRVGTLPDYLPYVALLDGGSVTIPENALASTYELDDGRKVATYFYNLVFLPDGRALLLESFEATGEVILRDAALMP